MKIPGLLLFCIALVTSASSINESVAPKTTPSVENIDKKVVCYYGQNRQMFRNPDPLNITDINTRFCTHLIWSSMILTEHEDFNIRNTGRSEKVAMESFTGLKNDNLKVLLSWNVWAYNVNVYRSLILLRKDRRELIRKVIKVIMDNNFDGLDLDLAYDKETEISLDHQLAFMADLSIELKKNNYLFSMSATSNLDLVRRLYYIPEMARAVDFINLKADDLAGYDKTCKLLAPLYTKSSESTSLNKIVRHWITNDAPAHKLVLGIPTIGRHYTLLDGSKNIPGSPVTGYPVFMAYNRLCQMLRIENWDRRYAMLEKVNYAVNGREWITYNSLHSIMEKMEFVKVSGLGGAAAWDISWDDHKGNCGDQWPILKIMNLILRTKISRNHSIFESIIRNNPYLEELIKNNPPLKTFKNETSEIVKSKVEAPKFILVTNSPPTAPLPPTTVFPFKKPLIEPGILPPKKKVPIDPLKDPLILPNPAYPNPKDLPSLNDLLSPFLKVPQKPTNTQIKPAPSNDNSELQLSKEEVQKSNKQIIPTRPIISPGINPNLPSIPHRTPVTQKGFNKKNPPVLSGNTAKQPSPLPVSQWQAPNRRIPAGSSTIQWPKRPNHYPQNTNQYPTASSVTQSSIKQITQQSPSSNIKVTGLQWNPITNKWQTVQTQKAWNQGRNPYIGGQLMPQSLGNICTKEGFMYDRRNSTRFYRCVREGYMFRLYLYHCPNGLIFNRRSNNCQWK